MSETAPDRPPQPAPPTPGARRPTRSTAAAVGAGVAVLALVVALVLGTRGPDDAATTPDPAAAPTGTARTTDPAGPTDTAPTAASPDPSAPADPSTPRPPATEPPVTAAPDGGAAAPPAQLPEVDPLPALDPVPLDAPADFGTEVVARLAEIRRVDGEGRGPGEQSGPALAVTIQMENTTAEPVDLDAVVVNVLDTAGDVGQVLFGDPRSAPFTGQLPAGGASTATYVLRLPDPATPGVTVTLSYGAEAPTAVFAGPVPGAPASG